MLHVGLLLPPRFANLSFAPLAVFEAANMMLGEPYYEPHVVSPRGGLVVNSFGMATQTERADDFPLDTMLVGAPPDTQKPPADMLELLRRSSGKTRRIASICVAAFILGEAGLLDGRRSTTHWLFGKELQIRFPKTHVEIDRIFVGDGHIWTSAGMTAGIDSALAPCEREAGEQSPPPALPQTYTKSDGVQDALQYAGRNLSKPLSVDKLAEAACLSPRQFSRVFRVETGMSPAQAVENLRLEAARLMLEQGRLPVETIARANGFGDRERMRRSFLRTYGQTPQSIRNASRPLNLI